jgi:hypothetical protein
LTGIWWGTPSGPEANAPCYQHDSKKNQAYDPGFKLVNHLVHMFSCLGGQPLMLRPFSIVYRGIPESTGKICSAASCRNLDTHGNLAAKPGHPPIPKFQWQETEKNPWGAEDDKKRVLGFLRGRKRRI